MSDLTVSRDQHDRARKLARIDVFILKKRIDSFQAFVG
jgi:hypothetical protein